MKYGRWTVIESAGVQPGSHKRKIRIFCRCDCGAERWIDKYSLLYGITKSCGCLKDELTSVRSRTHGAKHSKLYNVWCSMKQRCQDTGHRFYGSYGGRGILVCERWQAFEAFRDDMGDAPPGMTLERRDNDAHYSPENCIWATRKDQANNRSSNRRMQYLGETMTLTQWAERLGLNRYTISTRLSRGASDAEALKPVAATLEALEQ